MGGKTGVREEIFAEGLDFAARSNSPPSFEALSRPQGTEPMLQNPTSAATSVRLGTKLTAVQDSLHPNFGMPRRPSAALCAAALCAAALCAAALCAADRRVLVLLLREHQV